MTGLLGLPELPDGWAWACLESLTANEPRAITDGPFGSNLKTEHYTDAGARVIRLQNIGEGEFRDERAYISSQHYERLAAHSAMAGDIVVASLGEELPRACRLPDLGSDAIVKADCIRVRPHPEVDATYLMWALNSPAVRRLLRDRVHGLGRPRLNLRDLRMAAIPVAPHEEQRRVVRALTEQLTRLSKAASDVTTLQGRLASVRAAVISSVRAPGSTLVALSEVVDRIEAGRSYQCLPRPAGDLEWGVVKVSAMTWGEFLPGENKALPPGRAPDPDLEIRGGDILVSRANTPAYVGAPVLVGATRAGLLLSDKSLRIVPKEGIDRHWLVNVMRSPFTRRQISAKASGTKESMRNISQKNLLSVLVPSPPYLSHQRSVATHIEDVLAGLDRTEAALSVLMTRLAQLRRTVLAYAFAGQLTLQDPADESAELLLERIEAGRLAEPIAGLRRRRAVPAAPAAGTPAIQESA